MSEKPGIQTGVEILPPIQFDAPIQRMEMRKGRLVVLAGDRWHIVAKVDQEVYL